MRDEKRGSLFVYFCTSSLVALVVLFLLTCAPATRAQSESINGTIRGRISDPSDQPVASAKVTALNNATGYRRNVDSGEDGYYVIVSLPLGTYTVTVVKDGELSKNDALTFAYVNTGGRQLQWLHNINLINPLGFLLDSRPVFDPRVNAGTRANPAFNNVTIQDVGTSSSYNALEVNYEHRFSLGLVASAAYIYSHTISDAPDVNGFEQNLVYVEDATNRLRDRSNSYINRPQSFTASVVWSPRLKVENSLVNRVLNDNELAMLTNIASGDEQNVTANANLNGDSLVTSITRPLGFGRNTLRGPNVYQFDLRYTRTLFTLKERFRAQFLTEATNVFNHPNVTSLKTGGVLVDTTGCPKTANGFTLDPRSEERRVGKECRSRCSQ